MPAPPADVLNIGPPEGLVGRGAESLICGASLEEVGAGLEVLQCEHTSSLLLLLQI